jgi:hypothetical protein
MVMEKFWMRLLPAFIIFALAISGLFGQSEGKLTAESREKIHKVEDTLGVLSYAVINDSLPEDRFGACRNLIPALVRALKEAHSFEYGFDRLKNISIQYPQDSSFRIFTWQLYVDKDDYRYYGAIQMNSPELRLYPLIDRSFQLDNIEYAQLPPDKWYGAVYYNLKQVNHPDGPRYLLFGYDGFEFFRKRKVLDVLTFNREGKPVFGAPIFDYPETSGSLQRKSRLVLEYSAAATIRLNYDEALDMIIFDHLIPAGGNYDGGPVNLPDGSYEGYRIENNELVYVSKVWDQIQEEAPRPMPILDKRNKKDLFGNH